ncbi:MAG: hypothetical protein ACXACG_10995 [Candidatus Thorarchaeota archaeon]
MSEKPSKRIKKAVKSWFTKEGSKLETISNPRAEFLFKVKFQRFFFTVVRPNERNFIQLESQALKFSFTKGVTLGFIKPRPDQQGPKPPGPGFVVSDRIYDDGFSEDRLWGVMRRLHSAVDMSIALLNEITGQNRKIESSQPTTA